MMKKNTNWIGAQVQALALLLFPATTPILKTDDHHILKYYVVINRVVQPVIHRVFSLLLLDDSKTIKELLFEIPGYSNAKYKKFYDHERSKLDNNEPSKGFDITLLYKLLQKICGLADTNSSAWSDHGTLENSLKRLKDHRNVFAHEEISFTSEELEEKMKDMEELCRNVLMATGLLKGQDLTAEVDIMKKEMAEVLLGNIDLWEPYKEALNQLRLEQTTVLTREGRKDIHRLGNALKVLNPFSWLLDSKYSHLDVENVFTDLLIEEKSNIEMIKLLTTKLPSGDLPNVIVVSGPPGIGKTSLFRYFVHDWLSSSPKVLGMENIDLVIPIELRHVYSDNVRDLLGNHLLHNVSRHLKIDDIISALKNISLLWVLDGYDEANLKTRGVIKELLQKFPNSSVLITTRTEFTQDIELCVNELHMTCLSVTLKGFTPSNIRECARKLISVSISDERERDEKCKEFFNFWQKGNLFQVSLLSTPLYVTIVVVLWLDSPDGLNNIETLSSLYSLFVDHIIQKLLVRDSYVQLNKRRNILEKKVNIFFNYLGSVLWGKDFEFSLKQYEVDFLEEKCSELELPFSDTMSAFFVYAERADSTGVLMEYTIIHRTMAEFMSARSFVNKMVSEGWDVMSTAEHFFKNKRKTFLQYEPQRKDLNGKYDVDNLSKNLPSDMFEKIHKKYLIMHSHAFLDDCEYCNKCDVLDRKISSDYFYKVEENGLITTRSNLLWCHVKLFFGGPWIMFLMGYMSVSGALNDSRCEQLGFIFCHTRGTLLFFGNFLISCIKEVNNSLFTEKLCKYIKNITWVFHEDEGFSEAKELLNFVYPQSVFLHHCKRHYVTRDGKQTLSEYDPSQFLLDSINLFIKYPVKVYLDLSYFFHQPDPDLEFTKKCLMLLMKDTSHCQLVSIRCCVDDDILRILKTATHVKELSIKFLGKDLSLVASLLETLTELKIFRLAIHPRTNVSPKLSKSIQKNPNIAKMSIVLTDFFSVNPQQLASFLKQLCPRPTHLILHGSVPYLSDVDILTYIAWVLVSVKPQRLLIILDISDRSHLSHSLFQNTYWGLRKLESFPWKLYGSCVKFIIKLRGGIFSTKPFKNSKYSKEFY
ncbi:uncharacterized protein [Palaemon carinicauda]|uniref:uncharacterized protein n=1 Tax=Palaemon carinicauda TaxID=392227 RepID=UPI0035B5B51A